MIDRHDKMFNGEYLIQELCRYYTYIIRIVKCKETFDSFEAKMKCPFSEIIITFVHDRKIPYDKNYQNTSNNKNTMY